MNRDSEGQMAFRGLFRPSAVGALAALVALAGCGGGGEQPITTPAPKTTTTVPSTTASLSPTSTTTSATTPPAGAGEKGYNGAVAVATAFLKAYNTANRDANTSAFDGLYTAECTDCAALRKAIQARADKGWHTKADVYAIQDVGISKYSGPDKPQVTAKVVGMVSNNPVSLFDRDGTYVDKFATDKATFEFSLVYQGGWQIVGLSRLS